NARLLQQNARTDVSTNLYVGPIRMKRANHSVQSGAKRFIQAKTDRGALRRSHFPQLLHGRIIERFSVQHVHSLDRGYTNSAAFAFFSTCSTSLHPGMTAVTAWRLRHQASAHCAMFTPGGTSSRRMR